MRMPRAERHLRVTRFARELVERLQLHEHPLRALTITILGLFKITPCMRHAAHGHHTRLCHDVLIARVAIAL